MKISHYILSLTIFAAAFSSCSDDYLSLRSDDANISMEKLYRTYSYVQNTLWDVYNKLPDGFSTFGMEGATDNAEFTNEGSTIQKFNMGTWDQFSNPDDIWSKSYKGIRMSNMYLENCGKINIEYIKGGLTSTDSSSYYNAKKNIKFMRGEFMFLKAYLYFELVKRYGAVPILTKTLDYDDATTWNTVQRNSVDEVMKHIVTLCDSAALIIPVNVNTSDTWYAKGRVTRGGILALKSRVTLYAASKQFTDAGSTGTWAQAAAAAKAVMDLGQYSLVSGANYNKLFGSSNTTQSEYIFGRNYGATNNLEFANFPVVVDGNTGKSLTPSQNLVDAFEVKGTPSVPFDWSNETHKANIYSNRDYRFNAAIVYNGVTYNSKVIYTYTGGTSGLPNTNATKTGYYLGKYIQTGINLTSNTTAIHAWNYFRYAEILLNYAEAMFNAYGAEGLPAGYTVTALAAINQVRTRAGLSALTAAQLTQAKIENERRVEFCFEDHRYWDVRRWGKAEATFGTANPIKKIVITNTGTVAAPTYTYSVQTLESRVFTSKMNWYPILQSEINKTDWTQNTGW